MRDRGAISERSACTGSLGAPGSASPGRGSAPGVKSVSADRLAELYPEGGGPPQAHIFHMLPPPVIDRATVSGAQQSQRAKSTSCPTAVNITHEATIYARHTALRNLHAGSPGCAPRRRRALQHAESLRVCCLSACAVCTALQRAPPQPLLRSNPAPPRRAAAAAHLGAAHPFSLALPPPRQPPPTLATGAPAAAPRPRDVPIAAAQAARACSSACCTALVWNGCSRVSTRGSAWSETMVRVVREEQP